MEYIVCSIRDEVSENFLDLNLELNENAAIRNFKHAEKISMEQQKGLFYTNASDFALYKLGSFDSASGSFTPAVPCILCRGGRADG